MPVDRHDGKSACMRATTEGGSIEGPALKL
jgi:hypothetical protein